MANGTPTSVTRSVLKALDVLECLQSSRHSLSPAEIAETVGITRPTAYRLLATMATRGWVVKESQNSTNYRLGYKVLQLAGAYLEDLDVRTFARPHMEQLAQRYDESITLWAFDDPEVVLLDKVTSSKLIQTFLPIGSRGCMHSKAVGKAILAHLSQEDQERILRQHGTEQRTAFTITDPDRLREELQAVRRIGYATAEREDIVELRAVGAAILNFQGAPVGGLAVSALVANMPSERMAVIGEALRETAEAISQELGYLKT